METKKVSPPAQRFFRATSTGPADRSYTPMKPIQQKVTVEFNYPVHFTKNLFSTENPLFEQMAFNGNSGHPAKALFILDQGVSEHHPQLVQQIKLYIDQRRDSLRQAGDVMILPGGEEAKNRTVHLSEIHEAIHKHGIDRHSYIVVIGGGAVIDAAGYAAATAHRGIRLIRVPTTVLAQNDAGIGVKNGVNAFGKKNFLGTFAPPYAVINDSAFLSTLEERDWLSGISEAIKVALLKDSEFFNWISLNSTALTDRNEEAMSHLIHRCAELHLNHIANSGDPFEMGSSRPLDFGHWSAHKLEQLSRYNLRHGEAVAIGIALDCVYSHRIGLLSESDLTNILQVIESCKLPLCSSELTTENNVQGSSHPIFKGLEEFREHLGGELTIMLLKKPGVGVEVHSVDLETYNQSLQQLRNIAESLAAHTP
ncbi:MAG: 3-dehydroquinate synthase [Balneolaceae bacterium]